MYFFFIAKRFLNSKKKDRFVNLAVNISIFISSIAIALLILSNSIAQGFQNDIVNKVKKYQGNIIIIENNAFDYQSITEKLKTQNEGIIESTGIIVSNNYTKSIGISASSNSKMKIDSNNTIPITIGKELAKDLNIKKNSVINIIIPVSAPAPFGIVPESLSCQVVSIKNFEIPELNDSYIEMNLEDLQKVLNLKGKVHKVKVYAKDKDYNEIKKTFPDKTVLHWKSYNKTLVKIIKAEEQIFKIILFILTLFICFISMLALAMFINSKKSEIKIIQLLGAPKKQVMLIFLCFSSFFSIISNILGSALGVLLCQNINTIIKVIEKLFSISIFNPDIHLTAQIPIFLSYYNIAYIALLNTAVSIIFTFMLSYKFFKK